MAMMQKVQVFTENHPFVGPLTWILCIQFFLVQLIAAAAWDIPYSLAHNPISDLGNTEFALHSGRFVCSPQNLLMNISFVVLGAFMAIGSLLIYLGFKKTTASFVGFLFMAIAGLGTILVGVFPENTIGQLHGFGAFLVFVFGNLSLVILGFALDLPKIMRYYTIFSGVLALTALVFYGTQNYLGLGEGGMERLVAYPQTLWLIVFGVYISAHRYRLNGKYS